MANFPILTTTSPSIATDTLFPTTELKIGDTHPPATEPTTTGDALPPTTEPTTTGDALPTTTEPTTTGDAPRPPPESLDFTVSTSSTISTSSRISTSSTISTSSRISTSSSISTSSGLPASTLPAPSTSVSSMIHPTSPTPLPGGLSTSAKIGIGLGVPLGVIVLAIVAFLGYLYGRRRGNERNTIPAADEQFHGFPGDKDLSAMQRQGGAGAVGPQQSDDNGGLPRYAEELQGSPGVKRHELPAQREVKGYFSPDVVTS